MFVCLLPARNCAHDLSEYFESVARFADAIVALDDGSTDETRAVLEAHPLVQRVLTNPRRSDYRGWDDAANRARLLEAAAELEPDWVISLDADERIDPTDAVALRAFVDGGAARDAAYLLRVYRMIDGLEHYDDASLWVGRLFPFEPGQTFPSDRLHFVPLPTSIPPDRWRRTTFRIQHLASATEDRRQQRFAKYREADPHLEFQSEYSHLLTPPGRLVRWWPRPVDLPVIANTAYRGPRSADGTYALSVIVVAPDEPDRIEAAAACIAAHQRGYAMVSGTQQNTTKTLSGWARHFLEHSTALPNAPAGELLQPPHRCSYARAALLSIGDFDGGASDDPIAAVNDELFSRGYGAYHEPTFVMVEHNDSRNPARLVRHRFAAGRRAARRLLADSPKRGWRRTRRIVGLTLLGVPRRLTRVTGNALRWGGSTRRWFLLAFPLVIVGVLSEWIGGCAELLRHRPSE